MVGKISNPYQFLKEQTMPALNSQILAFGKPGCILRERIGGRWRELIGLKVFSGRSQLAGNLSTPKTRQAPVTFCNGSPHWSSQWCTIAFSASWQRGRRNGLYCGDFACTQMHPSLTLTFCSADQQHMLEELGWPQRDAHLGSY